MTDILKTGHVPISSAQAVGATQIAETGHVPILGIVHELPLAQVKPSPENDELYRPIDTTAKDFRAMVASVREHGIKEPLVLTLDDFILSGHRRRAAAQAAGLKIVPCRYEEFRRSDFTHDDYVETLREYNRQRTKSYSEQLREAIVDADPDEAYRALVTHREASAQVKAETITIEGTMRRAAITEAKEPFLRAIERVLQERRNFWPLSDRSIHYALLNAPPLIHAKKPDSIYRNNLPSYKALTDLVTRARLVGRIPMTAISDPTRPITVWNVHETPATFFAYELEQFLKGYRRNLQQSQPNHIEIIGEKNTIESTLRPVASQFNIPLTIGRGFSSLEPRYKVAQRFKRSGKHTLILLTLSDFDPSGEEIAHSFARSIRDDFEVRNIELIKVALTATHVARYQLPPQMQAKQSDSRARKFTEQHGEDVYELEALPPETLQIELRRAIDSVLDIRAFNYERAEEKNDAVYLDTLRRRAHLALQDAAEEPYPDDEDE